MFHEPPKVIQTAGSQRNVTLRIRGRAYTELDEHARFAIRLPDAGLKLSSLVWLIQEKMGLHLWVNETEIMLPMESRNSIRFDTPVPALESVLYLTPFNLDLAPVTQFKAYFLVLDFDR